MPTDSTLRMRPLGPTGVNVSSYCPGTVMFGAADVHSGGGTEH